MADRTGTTLLLALWIPGADRSDDAAAIAGELATIINNERASNAGPYQMVHLAEPAPRWDVPSIVCPRCWRRSFSPVDIDERYCGSCLQYHPGLGR